MNVSRHVLRILCRYKSWRTLHQFSVAALPGCCLRQDEGELCFVFCQSLSSAFNMPHIFIFLYLQKIVRKLIVFHNDQHIWKIYFHKSLKCNFHDSILSVFLLIIWYFQKRFIACYITLHFMYQITIIRNPEIISYKGVCFNLQFLSAGSGVFIEYFCWKMTFPFPIEVLLTG